MAVKDDAADTLGNAERRCPVVVRRTSALPAVGGASDSLQLGDELLARQTRARLRAGC
jgi:hypothetical protein